MSNQLLVSMTVLTKYQYRVATACLMEVEPEKGRWHQITREWYGAGLAKQPETGKLLHWVIGEGDRR